MACLKILYQQMLWDYVCIQFLIMTQTQCGTVERNTTFELGTHNSTFVPYNLMISGSYYFFFFKCK